MHGSYQGNRDTSGGPADAILSESFDGIGAFPMQQQRPPSSLRSLGPFGLQATPSAGTSLFELQLAGLGMHVLPPFFSDSGVSQPYPALSRTPDGDCRSLAFSLGYLTQHPACGADGIIVDPRPLDASILPPTPTAPFTSTAPCQQQRRRRRSGKKERTELPSVRCCRFHRRSRGA